VPAEEPPDPAVLPPLPAEEPPDPAVLPPLPAEDPPDPLLLAPVAGPAPAAASSVPLDESEHAADPKTRSRPTPVPASHWVTLVAFMFSPSR
jgi:hypothetical protein